MRIGVGVRAQAGEEASLQRFGTYEIVDDGKWTIEQGQDRIAFVHELKDGTGYAYVYRKTLRLDGSQLVIDHALKNTGTKPIATSVYNHNFFTLDRKTTGPDNVVRFPFAPKAARPLNGMAEVRGREIAHRPPLRSQGERLHRARGIRDRGVRLWLRDGEPRHRRRRSRRPATGRCRSCSSGPPTRRCARALRRRQRRAWPDDVLDDHLHVLRGEEDRCREAVNPASDGPGAVSGSR